MVAMVVHAEEQMRKIQGSTITFSLLRLVHSDLVRHSAWLDLDAKESPTAYTAVSYGPDLSASALLLLRKALSVIDMSHLHQQMVAKTERAEEPSPGIILPSTSER